MPASIRRRIGRENEVPSRVRSIRCSAPRLSPPTGSRPAAQFRTGQLQRQFAPPPGRRSAARTAGRPAQCSRRRTANPTAASLAGSSHCTSSMTSSTGADRASMVNGRPRNAAAITRGCGGCRRRLLQQQRHPQRPRLRRRQLADHAGPHGSSRSASPANSSLSSLRAGIVRSTVNPRSAASAAPARSRVVLPAPAAPASTSAPRTGRQAVKEGSQGPELGIAARRPRLDIARAYAEAGRPQKRHFACYLHIKITGGNDTVIHHVQLACPPGSEPRSAGSTVACSDWMSSRSRRAWPRAAAAGTPRTRTGTGSSSLSPSGLPPAEVRRGRRAGASRALRAPAETGAGTISGGSSARPGRRARPAPRRAGQARTQAGDR